MKNAEWMIKQGYKFSDLHIRFKGFEKTNTFVVRYKGEKIDEFKLRNKNELFIECAYKKWLDMEHKEPILDDAEKQYLSAVIKPFRKYVISIRLQDVGVTSNQRVTVFYNDYVFGRSSFALPTFKKGTMYKGMELGKKYTPEELGL